MKHCFTLNVADSPSALERILRTVRHRGFNLTGMNLSTDQGMMDMQLCVESDHPAHLLHNQLAKLHDVVHISSWDATELSRTYDSLQTATRQ